MTTKERKKVRKRRIKERSEICIVSNVEESERKTKQK